MLWEVISCMSRYFYILFRYSTQETLLVHCKRFKNKNTVFSTRLASVIMQCAFISLYEDYRLMGWHNITSHRKVMFWRNLLLQSSVCDSADGVGTFLFNAVTFLTSLRDSNLQLSLGKLHLAHKMLVMPQKFTQLQCWCCHRLAFSILNVH